MSLALRLPAWLRTGVVAEAPPSGLSALLAELDAPPGTRVRKLLLDLTATLREMERTLEAPRDPRLAVLISKRQTSRMLDNLAALEASLDRSWPCGADMPELAGVRAQLAAARGPL